VHTLRVLAVEQLFARRDLPLRERTLWRLLYETAARANELLALNVEDLDLANRRARVHSKGGAVEWVFWQTGSAQLLPRLLTGRVRSLERYARPGPEAVARHLAQTDPARRRS
jgi:integrase